MGQNQILFQCFEHNFDTFRLICSTITLFSNIWDGNSILFKWFQQKRIYRYFECLRKLTNTNLSNVSSEHPIIFDGFQQRSDTFQMFWVEVRFFSNVLYQKQMLFECPAYNYESSECFEWTSNKFRMNSAEIRYFSNVLGRS